MGDQPSDVALVPHDGIAAATHATGSGTASGSGTAPGSGTASGSGTAYLQRRREQRRSREDAGHAATERGEDIHAALCGLAAASRRHPPQDQRLSGHEGWMLLNGAYLVDADRADELRKVVTAFDDQPGLRVELTGPWAPYSFAAWDEES